MLGEVIDKASGRRADEFAKSDTSSPHLGFVIATGFDIPTKPCKPAAV